MDKCQNPTACNLINYNNNNNTTAVLEDSRVFGFTNPCVYFNFNFSILALQFFNLTVLAGSVVLTWSVVIYAPWHRVVFFLDRTHTDLMSFSLFPSPSDLYKFIYLSLINNLRTLFSTLRLNIQQADDTDLMGR